MTKQPLSVTSDGGVDHLLIDSPGNRNALSIALMEQLIEAIGQSLSKNSRGLVLDHTGDIFCAGVDLKERLANSDKPQIHSELLGDLLLALWKYPSPVICRVGGRVRGGGMGLLACSDMVVCSERADFAFSEVRVGVAPALVGNFCLSGISSRTLKPWLLTGEPFSAVEAFRLGLVTRIASNPATSVAPELEAMLKGAPESQKVAKRLVRDLAGETPADMLRPMQELSAKLFTTDEAAEGMAAFRERRSPSWAPVRGLPSFSNGSA